MIPTSSWFAFNDISKKEEKRNLIVLKKKKKKKKKKIKKNMRKSVKGCFIVITFLCAIILITAGIVMMNNQTLWNYLIEKIRSEKKLIDNTMGYNIWLSPLDLVVNIYLFHVDNPDDVLKGELPKLIERGPYVYDLILEKDVLSVNDIRDEITYNMKKTYYFNEEESGEFLENDEIVLLNMAYLGTINTLAGFSIKMLEQYGDSIGMLFPEENHLFVKAKVKDILFSGISFKCDVSKHKNMKLICMTLKGKKPPILWNAEIENTYMYSLFGTTNGTWIGPITINRGVQDETKLGSITSMYNKRKNKYWITEECNIIKGSDSIIFPFYNEPPPRIYIYAIETCRASFVEFKGVQRINQFEAWRYVYTSENWSQNESDCYCPTVKHIKTCPPIGLMDVDKCMKVPMILSEPHFLYADPKVLDYVPDLNPKEEFHSSFILIDTLTGKPLRGYKKIQINMKISPQPIELLANVTEGYFPVVWISQGVTEDKKNFDLMFMIYRIRSVILVLQWLPLVIGICLLLLILLCYKLPIPRRKIRSIDSTKKINPTLPRI
ncbi:sensory neuron membrane protein 2-like [Vespula squamosa]|uniref:Sensory neuron membrane protein 2-like n=1 Tax=Vespula squamosa TaxID=30214 RepID=A0ABD2A3I1_VESSQ